MLLPNLEVRFDSFSFQYLPGLNFFKVPPLSFENTIHVDSLDYVSTIHLTQRATDILRVFKSEVNANIIEDYGSSRGYIVCSIRDAKTENKYGWAVLSGLTLGIPNLFGMPLGKVQTYLDVQVDFYSSKREKVKTYSYACEGHAWIALYYGYSERRTFNDSPVNRKATLEAFKCALSTIKAQINDDYHDLTFKLR